MAKKKGGSVKSTDLVIITSVDLTADVTGSLPAANGGTGGLKLATGTWGAPGAEAANVREVSLQLVDVTGANIADANIEVMIRVSDSLTDAEPSATATLAAAATPVGTLLSGSGSATVTMRTDASGVVKVAVTEAAVGNRYLWVSQGFNSLYWVRATAAPLVLAFA